MFLDLILPSLEGGRSKTEGGRKKALLRFLAFVQRSEWSQSSMLAMSYKLSQRLSSYYSIIASQGRKIGSKSRAAKKDQVEAGRGLRG